ncbi:MAG TPA: M15 family metallopeptidase [Methylomirabilota bacterium]|jgi:hypothetical protein|nr:M15 family metallopeptidase [Methylomirabilota bacterium]
MRPADLTALAELAEPLRSRASALLIAAKDRVTIVSGRRTLEEQIALRKAHCGPSWYDQYQKPSSQCSPPTARPGHSKHETGEAVDFGGDLGLAAALAPKSGLKRTVASEAWHYEVDPAAVGFMQIPDLPGGLDEGLGKVFGGVDDAVGSALGKIVDPLLDGLKRIALYAVLIAGGAGLILMGGIRSTGGAK